METTENAILDALEPYNDCLEKLGIANYLGLEFPKWVGDPSFRQLTRVSIRGCKKCTSLQPLGQLESLKELSIQDMGDVKVVWSTNGRSGVADSVFPCLEELNIEGCPLVEVSLKAPLLSLRDVRIDNCGYGLMRSLVHVAPSVTKLEIKSISELTNEVWRGVILVVKCSWCGVPFNGRNCRQYTNVSFGDEFVCNPDPISNNETPDFSYPPSQPQTSSFDEFHCFGCGDPLEDGIEDYRNERIDIHYRRECEIKIDELKESTIPLNEIISQDPLSISITPVLPIEDPDDSLIMGDEDLSTIPEKESDEFIKSSVEDLVPIPSESEDTSDSECDLTFCDNSMTFSNPLFDSNDDFTSSDDESLSDEDVSEDNFKIYSNPFFEFDDEYISSGVNPLFRWLPVRTVRGRCLGLTISKFTLFICTDSQFFKIGKSTHNEEEKPITSKIIRPRSIMLTTRVGGDTQVANNLALFSRAQFTFLASYSLLPHFIIKVEENIDSNKFATCTFLDAALTWWNGHLNTLGHDAAYAMTWETLKKKITDKYCPRGKIKKLEIELWNLKGKVDKYIGGLPDNIHKNFMSVRSKTIDEAIELANDLMDQKLRTYVKRQTESKRKFDNNNQAQQLPKRQNVAQAYAVRTSERKEYAKTLPLCNKCKFHHNGSCTTKCVNYKKGHYKSDCPELKNRNHGNQVEGTKARGMMYVLGGEETNHDLDDIEDDINA
nr:hypothetical protein [Tanacetum cinerariifolium]